MPSNRDDAHSDALKATSYDLDQLRDRHVADLRDQGLEELASQIEAAADLARAFAQEFDTKGGESGG